MGEWRYNLTHLSISALVGGDWSVSRSGRFILWESALGIILIGGWMDHRTGLVAVANRKRSCPASAEVRIPIFQIVA
jgi:hypothetical protein